MSFYTLGNPPRTWRRQHWREMYRWVRICNREAAKLLVDLNVYGFAYTRTGPDGMPQHVPAAAVVKYPELAADLKRLGSTVLPGPGQTFIKNPWI